MEQQCGLVKSHWRRTSRSIVMGSFVLNVLFISACTCQCFFFFFVVQWECKENKWLKRLDVCVSLHACMCMRVWCGVCVCEKERERERERERENHVCRRGRERETERERAK